MAESLQIAGMDAKQIAERHIVELYLAGKLGEEDERAFEAHVEAHPEIIRDIEVAARMKSGLVALRDQGVLAKLLRNPTIPWYRRPSRLAASLAGVVAVAMLFLQPWRGLADTNLIVATAQELAGPGRNSPPVGARMALARSRSLKPPEMTAPPPGSAIEITLQVLEPDAGAKFSVRVLRVTGGSSELVGELENAHTDEEGNLTFFTRSEMWSEGTYLIRASSPAAREPLEFLLRVTSKTP